MPNQGMSAERFSPDSRGGPLKKAGSSVCPPEGYIKRLTCPTRQQFYKDLKQQEQRVEGPRRVYHVASKYKCPRARDKEVPSPEVGATDARGTTKKKTPRREEGDTKYEDQRKKLNHVAEKKRLRPPQKYRKGVGNLNSIQYCVMSNYTLAPSTIDEAVQAYCKEATKNTALYNTQAGEEPREKLDRARDSDMKMTRPVSYSKAKIGPSPNRYDGLSEHLKYGLFGRRNTSEEPVSRHVFGPAQPPNLGLDLDRRNHPANFDSGVANQAFCAVSHSPRLQPHLVVSKIMHVDIKPHEPGGFCPPRRRNTMWPGRPLRTRSFISSPAFGPHVHTHRMLHPAPVAYHASTAVMPMPSNYPQNRFKPYGQITRCPSQYHNYNKKFMYEPRKKLSPPRYASRHNKILDRQLTSPYSRTRSSQSGGAFTRTRMSYAPKYTETRTTLQPRIMRKKSQHSIASTIRLQTNFPKKASSINRNVGMPKRVVASKSQFLRKAMSVTSKKERDISGSVAQRQAIRRYISSRDMDANQQTAAKLPSHLPPSPKPSQISSTRRRTFNRCLTPTLTRKILSGEVVQPADNSPKVTTAVETQPKTSDSASSHGTPTSARRITSMPTQTVNF